MPTSASPSSHWYVIYLRSHYELKVHNELARRSIESFQPLIWETRQWSDRKKKILVPLFPGYDFVRFDLKDRERVMQVDGFVKFISIDRQPSVVPDEQIQWVKQILAAPETLRKESAYKTEPSFAPEQYVQVASGPFAGVRGHVLQLNGATRVVILIETIGQAISVEVPIHNLKLVAA